MTAPVPIDARAEAKERFYRAALWWMADQSCSNALAEMEDAYEALSALGRAALAETLARAEARRGRGRMTLLPLPTAPTPTPPIQED